jgi:CRP-like cAMP-binding protein
MATLDDVEKNPFFRAVAAADPKRAMPLFRYQSHVRGECLWSEGDTASVLTLLVSGRLKLVKTGETGRETIVDIVGPGELTCCGPALMHAPQCCGAVALDDAETVSFPSVEALDLLGKAAGAKELVREMATRAMGVCERITELASGKVEQRVAKALLRLTDRFGVDRGKEGTWVARPLARQGVADLAGTTLESAIRGMSSLQRRSIVRSSPQGFLVQDRAGLEGLLGARRGGAQRPRRVAGS